MCLVATVNWSVYMSVCSFVLVQVIQEWIALISSTSQHLSSPFVLEKTETKEKRVKLRVSDFFLNLFLSILANPEAWAAFLLAQNKV